MRGPSRWPIAALAMALSVALVGAGCSSDRAASPAPSTSGSDPTPTTAPDDDKTANDAVAEARLSQLPAFSNVPWADELKAEQDRFSAAGRVTDSPYGEYSLPDFAGRYTNVTNSERRTLPSTCDCPKRTVWLMGASSAFGLGQRDDYTTASYLVRAGDDNGMHLDVRNLAVPGHTFIDELEGLKTHLELDPVKPDLVVFFNGFNDALAAYMYAVINDGDLVEPIRFGEWVDDFLEREDPPQLEEPVVRSVSDHVASSYLDTQKQVAEVLSSAGIEGAYFFQPDGFTSPLQAEGLAQSLNKTMAELATDSDFSEILRRSVAGLGGDVVDLRAPMAAFDEPVFADTTHFNEVGAEFLAGLIFAAIENDL